MRCNYKYRCSCRFKCAYRCSHSCRCRFKCSYFTVPSLFCMQWVVHCSHFSTPFSLTLILELVPKHSKEMELYFVSTQSSPLCTWTLTNFSQSPTAEHFSYVYFCFYKQGHNIFFVLVFLEYVSVNKFNEVKCLCPIALLKAFKTFIDITKI